MRTNIMEQACRAGFGLGAPCSAQASLCLVTDLRRTPICHTQTQNAQSHLFHLDLLVES